jgi:hypothetical protein
MRPTAHSKGGRGGEEKEGSAKRRGSGKNEEGKVIKSVF